MKKARLLGLTLAGAALLGALTWAAQAARVTGEVENTVHYGQLALRVVETDASGKELTADDIASFDLAANAGVTTSADNVKWVERNVMVENRCGHSMYVRVRPVVTVTDSAGGAVDNDGRVTFTLADDWSARWTYVVGGDTDGGWYVYNGVLDGKGDRTPALITSLTFDADRLKDMEVRLTVDAQAVQREYNDLPASGNYADVAGWPED